jgi:MIP family channel proteins
VEATVADPGGARAVPPRHRDHEIPARGPAAYAAEVLGTLMLVLFVVLVLSVGAPAPDGLNFTDFAVIGLVHAFVLSLLIWSLGSASGAHFNPAVTIALAVKRKISGKDAGVYILCQLVGAVLGALIAKALIPDAADAVNVGATTVGEGRFLDGAIGKGLLAEFIGTFALMWAIMAMAVNPRGNPDWAPWVIGTTLALGVMTIGPLTGAGFNPARSFGPGILGDDFEIGDFLIAYTAGPILGALAAAFAYTAIVLDPQHKLEQRPIDTYEAS